MEIRMTLQWQRDITGALTHETEQLTTLTITVHGHLLMKRL